MEFRIVKNVLQNECTKPEDSEYGDATWCVEERIYIEILK